jgi:hypothetical protein
VSQEETPPPGAGGGSAEENGGSKKYRHPRAIPRAPIARVYERWWESYRDGLRTAKKLAAAHGISPHTARRAIIYGWPEANFPALKDRAELHDRKAAEAMRSVVTQAEVAVLSTKSTGLLGTWEDTARAALENVKASGDALKALGERIAEAAKIASFVKYRKVPDVDPASGKPRRDASGNVIMVERAYVDGAGLAAAMRLWVSAQKEQIGLAHRLFGEVFPRDLGGDEDLPELSEAQLALLEAGEIPEDIEPEALAKVVIALGKEGTGA